MPASVLGILFRSYASAQENVDETVQRALRSAQHASQLMIDGKPAFGCVLFVVPVDHDCGLTATKLKTAFKQEMLQAEVLEVRGHHSREALNEGVKFLESAGMSHALIVSNKALSYVTPSVLQQTLLHLDEGAAVVGVRLKELDGIHKMPIENTCAAWNIAALRTVGFFDSDRGVEEVAPIARLVLRKLPCLLIPEDAHAHLDVRTSTQGQERHREVVDTKRERQEQEAMRIGVELTWLTDQIHVVA